MSFDPEYHIDLTGVDPTLMLKAAYDLSRPQGMGFIHFKPEPLTDQECEAILARGHDHLVFSTDYVNGRAMKLALYRDGDKQYMKKSWYDHSSYDFAELLNRLGFGVEANNLVDAPVRD